MHRGRKRIRRYLPKSRISTSSRILYDRDLHENEFNRVSNLSDGVFAIALTLLVLSLEVPSGLNRSGLHQSLLNLTPMLIAFLVSLGIISLFWFSHHELMARLQSIDSRFMFLNIIFLGMLALIPFVQQLQGNYPLEPVAYMVYSAGLAFINLLDTSMHVHAHHARLLTRRWSTRQYRVELVRGLLPTGIFLLSIPLALVLVNWTVLLWLTLLPLDRLIVRGSDV